MDDEPAAVAAAAVPPRTRPSIYPEPFASRMAGRIKRPLGDLFGLKGFGVNLTRLAPGAVTALHHRHTRSDEFIYVLEGTPTLFLEDGVMQLAPGMAAGFRAAGPAHHLENRSDGDCVILEIGDRMPDDDVSYPDDDLQAVTGAGGRRYFARKDGTPY